MLEFAALWPSTADRTRGGDGKPATYLSSQGRGSQPKFTPNRYLAICMQQASPVFRQTCLLNPGIRKDPVVTRAGGWARYRVGTTIAVFVALCGLAPAALALRPREGEPIALVRLRPRTLVPDAVGNSDARVLWMSAQGHVLVLHASTPDLISALYRDDAALILAAAPLTSCLPRAGATPSITTGVRRS